ncbi:transposase family protein [Streptomyces sp. c-19]|uniref:transposase family protein n=1 Tax=Streptomyces sp. c-19 TaxID=2789275 RepID=UPI003980A9F3
MPSGLLDALARVPDPRNPRGVRFRLATLLAVGVCALTSAGHNSLTAVPEWVRRCDQDVLARLGCPFDSFTKERRGESGGRETAVRRSSWRGCPTSCRTSCPNLPPGFRDWRRHGTGTCGSRGPDGRAAAPTTSTTRGQPRVGSPQAFLQRAGCSIGWSVAAGTGPSSRPYEARPADPSACSGALLVHGQRRRPGARTARRRGRPGGTTPRAHLDTGPHPRMPHRHGLRGPYPS